MIQEEGNRQSKHFDPSAYLVNGEHNMHNSRTKMGLARMANE